METIKETLASLEATSNLRKIPDDNAMLKKTVDLSGNDYLGLADDRALVTLFLETLDSSTFRAGSSASRLLASCQNDYSELEGALSEAYGREALLFNSGYHANVGILQALGSKSTLFVADKLVHASIIDGMNLAKVAGASFVRFRHNDYAHLRRIMETEAPKFSRVVIVAESVYSMDGDRSDIESLVDAKSMHSDAILYIDEAHAVGVLGEGGLGLAHGRDEVDIIIGTMGKALASMGAYAITSDLMKRFLVNRCRSLIFSTALPPLSARWSLATFRHSLGADTARQQLAELSRQTARILTIADGVERQPSHILPLILGDPESAVRMAARLRESGFKVLPIRTPTVPPGTDRLRFSLSASLKATDIEPLEAFFGQIKR